MIIYPVKIYRPNEFGELEYVETIYPDQLSETHWNKFPHETGKLNLRRTYIYPKMGSSNEDSQDKC